MSNVKKLIGVCGIRAYEQNIMPFIHILKRECEKKDFRVLLFCGSTVNLENTDETIGQYQLVDLMRQVDLSALIILTETIKNESMLERLVSLGKEKHIPVFSLDRKLADCYNLLMDNGNCFEQIVRHVVEYHGCRCVNMIGGDRGDRFSEERIAIYRKVLEENGIPVEEERIDYGNYWEMPVRGVVKRIVESKLPFPDAIICANDIMAHAAIANLNEYGYEVPEDLIVTGYDGTRTGKLFMPSVSTGGPDYEMTVQCFLKELTKYLEGNEPEPIDILTPVLFKPYQSCGCEPKILPKKDRRISELLAELGNGNWHMKSMHQMISDSFGKENIEDVFSEIYKYMDFWFDFYRYLCIKSELAHSWEIPEKFSDMTCMLDANRGEFREVGSEWHISDLQRHINKILEEENVNIILIHLLISGKDVYGFGIDGFNEVQNWEIRQCDEFANFLSQILNTVTYNFKMKVMNEDLRKMNAEIEKMSLCDSLTGIYNRRGFFQKIRAMIEQQENTDKYLYLFMVDMDGLKFINDNFGHAEGDYAITTLAKALEKMGSENSVCARVGGDEFICAYLEEEAGKYSSELFSQKMQVHIKEIAGVTDRTYSISASVGMISDKVSAKIDLDAIINRADDDMYHHKIAANKERKR